MRGARVVAGFFAAFGAACAQQYVITTVAGGIAPLTPASALHTSIGDPPRVAADGNGNLYFGSLHCVFKVDGGGVLTRIAGTGRYGNSGDGGPATSAQLAFPDGLAVDASGNVYVADKDSAAIRKITPGGTIATLPISPPLNGPTGLALDSTGNLYVADTGNNQIRKITPAGAVSTAAGADGSLSGPEGVAVDAAGTLYIADTFHNVVRRVAADGAFTTVAGIGISGFSGDAGPAAQAALFLPTDVAVDGSGNLYIADFGNSRVVRVTGGVFSTIAGSRNGARPADGEGAVSVRLSGPTGVAAGSAGTVYFAEGSIGSGSGLTTGDFKIWRVTPDGLLFSAAGNGLESYSGDRGPAGSAQFNTPAGLALDPAGNLYVADSLNHRVRRIAADGMVTTVAGSGVAGFSGDGGPAVIAQLDTPTGVAVDSAGNLLIADSLNHRIRKVISDGTIGTLAGNGNAGFFGDGAAAIRAALHNPQGVGLDAQGNLYIADTLNQRVRKIDASGVISTVAGNGLQGYAGDGAAATSAQLNGPAAVAVDSAGNVYIADQGNGRVRRVAGGVITTAARLSAPAGLAVDATGGIYVADPGTNQILALTGAILAGNGGCCYLGDGGAAASAPLNRPWGLAVDGAGRIFFADAGNNAIRLLQPGSSAPTIASVVNGASNLPGAIAPGEIVVVFGSGLGPAPLTLAQAGGATVTFNGTPGTMVYSSATQVSAVVPAGVSGGAVQVVVRYGGVSSTPAVITLAAASPAIFTADASGSGQILAVNADGSLNGVAHPAPVGSSITLYATGLGTQWLQGAAPVSLTIGDQQVAGLQISVGSPLPEGLAQISAPIPGAVQPGDGVPVILRVGDAASPVGTTLAVK